MASLRKIVIIFLSISLNMCFGCSKELSHRDSSFEYTQHMFWLKNNNNNFQLHTLVWGPERGLGGRLICWILFGKTDRWMDRDSQN